MHQRFGEWLEFWQFLLQRFFVNRGPDNAAALTYTTLFAVVPMMTVTFAMLSMIPAFQGTGEQIQAFIFHNFVPSAGETLQQYLHDFTNQARQLTWIGVAILAVTAFWMLVTIERTFNDIWHVRQPRRGIATFLLYWAILSLGPILLGAGFAVSTYVASLSLISGPDAIVGAKTLLRFTPLLFSVAAFTLLYAAVPNARVSLRHALWGGLFTAVLLELAKALFGLYVRFFPGYQLIYGAFATVPLFLLWVFLSWLIVLIGAELVCNLGVSRSWRRRALPRFLVLLGVLEVFHTRQRSGLKVRHRDVRRQGWGLPEHEWEELVSFLEGQRLVASTGGDSWMLSRDLGHYSLQRLIEHSPWPVPQLAQLPDDLPEPWYPRLREAIEQLSREQSRLFDDSLANWLHADEGDANSQIAPASERH